MGRKKRYWDPNSFYHIVCRGNRRDSLFCDRGDYLTFLYILKQVFDKAPYELASYCLMTNHYHLQLRSTEQPISKIMSLINKRYADYYNNKYHLTGHVFERRYYDHKIHSPEGMIEVSCYIHLNPVKANMTITPEDYPWSSYADYMNNTRPYNLKPDHILDLLPGNFDKKRAQYNEIVIRKMEESLIQN
ncbi:transposase [Heyndrickxia acidiproducens]|uniref:transposase n=1 Tax=Heyndrickxia acidiproducens TaxID=1121084 RepID=UPI0003AADD60|nr:transposase [Heyndrickxia acidiproducens]